jgi:hypothetical protein
MPATRSLVLARWLLTAFLLALLFLPTGFVEGRSPSPSCRCGMAPGHCSCALGGHAMAGGGHPSCGGEGEPDRCFLSSSQPPMEDQTLPLGPELRARLGVLRHRGPEGGLRPCGTVASLDVLLPAGRSAPPEVPPPRISFRIG